MKYQRKSNQGFDRFLIHEWLESCEEISATEKRSESRRIRHFARRQREKNRQIYIRCGGGLDWMEFPARIAKWFFILLSL